MAKVVSGREISWDNDHGMGYENTIKFPEIKPAAPRYRAPQTAEPVPVVPHVTVQDHPLHHHIEHEQPRFEGRIRSKSLSEQTQEVAKQLAPPISLPLVLLCLAWYLSSAISNNIAKAILDEFNYPVTLTMVQFVYAVGFSTLFCALAKLSPGIATLFPKNTVGTSGVPYPSKYIVQCTGPMACFQLVGHILSFMSMSEIPVSMVHAIKSLSPLFTVMAQTLVFRTKYSWATYAALMPLIVGVIMTCGAGFLARPFAIIYALAATIVFVSQNMYSKRLLTTGSVANDAPKLDKMAILCWCNALAFTLTLPIWLCSDGLRMFNSGINVQGSSAYLLTLFTLNGFSHFSQNLLAFVVLGSISTVSYSIASLFKRIVVITVAIVWFGQHVSKTQGWGIIITFFGLYLYDKFGSKPQSQEGESLPR